MKLHLETEVGDLEYLPDFFFIYLCMYNYVIPAFGQLHLYHTM